MRALGTALSLSDQPCFCKSPSPKTFSAGWLLGCHLEAWAEGQTCPAVKLTMVPSGPWTNQGSPLLEKAMGTSLHKGGWVSSFGLLRRDCNRLHACPLPCLSCCLRQRPSFLTPPRGIYCDSKTSTKSKAKGSPPPILTNTGPHMVTPSGHGPWFNTYMAFDTWSQ